MAGRTRDEPPRRVAGEVAAVSLAFITNSIHAERGTWHDERPANHSALWTEADDAKLTLLWPDHSRTRKQVAAEMGRTFASCILRANYLSLKRRAPKKRVRVKKPPGPVPAEDTAGRAAAERQAETIRAWHAYRGLPVEVAVVYVPGPSGYRGGWSAVIQTTVEIPKS